MRYSIKRSADDPTHFQLVLEAQNNEEDDILRSLSLTGSILALGETKRGRAELVLGTSALIEG
jgi:hypothetical protein